ncbi:MAG: histone deacetylase [Acidimicrobiales bacterium]
MPVLVEHHPACAGHDSGRGHPERPSRLEAVVKGIEAAALGDAVQWVQPRAALREELALVHDPRYIEALEGFCRQGGGALDLDTGAGPGSWDAALVAAGAGLDAIERIEASQAHHPAQGAARAQGAFCAVRPPGHHATARRAQGFCLFNNVAVCAAVLAGRDERVVIIDWDVHHGNGTQDTFYDDPRVLYVSMHQSPLYPFTGRLEETGNGPGRGFNVNLPFPPGATGDVYAAAMEDVVGPAAEEFRPTWVLVSAGFDAHRDDPLEDTALRLSAGDFGDLTSRAAALAPAGRCVLFLEGGYDLDALSRSAGACVAALVGVAHDREPPTTGGPGHAVVAAAARLRLG